MSFVLALLCTLVMTENVLAAEYCLWVIPSYGTGKIEYNAHSCSDRDYDTCSRSSHPSGYELYSSKSYSSQEECESEYQKIKAGYTEDEGFCYVEGNSSCTSGKRYACAGRFYANKDYGNAANASQACKAYIDSNYMQGVYCYHEGECTRIGTMKIGDESQCRGGTLFNSEDSEDQNRSDCETYKRSQTEGKFCLYKCNSGRKHCVKVSDASDDGSTCKSTYNGPGTEGCLGALSKSNMDYSSCIAEVKRNWCKTTDESGHQSCSSDASLRDDAGNCKNGSTYYTQADCENTLPPEEITIELPEYEHLSSTQLDQLNPLMRSDDLKKPEQRTPGALVSRLVRNIIFPIAGLLLFLMITWSGFQIVQGGMMGDDNTVSSGKQRLTAAIVGFLLLFSSYWLWSLVEAAFGLGTTV